MITKENVENYYNSFKSHQKTLGINIRHRRIFKDFKKAGLKHDSNVLEVGCGVGTVSHLILKYITAGKYVGFDISSESIELAKKFNSFHKNAEFYANDMSSFTHKTKFDFVVFPDVLEHIPVEQHANIFKTIAELTTPDATVLINIPEPLTLDWHWKNKAEDLQIIDQPLSIRDLCNNCYPYGFHLCSMNHYGLYFVDNEYLSIVLKKYKPIEKVYPKSKIQLGIENFISKF